MTRDEAKEFDTFSYNGDMDYIKESSVSQRIDAIFDYFEKEKEELIKKIEASKAYFDLKLDGNFLDEK